MRTRNAAITLACTLALAFGSPLVLTGCANNTADSAGNTTTESTETATEATDATAETKESTPTTLADGTYEIEVTTDSSMFHAAHCTLEVKDGALTAHLALPGEGFSRLYFGTADQAAGAPDSELFDYYLGDDGLYTFDVPVAALDEDLTIAAFGQRRDTWYDHTILFASPTDQE